MSKKNLSTVNREGNFEVFMAKTKLLIEDPDINYEISEEDILIYAHQIGIDVENEKNLLWIAKEGLSANVPKPWKILCDEKDRIFYYNPKTKEKSWNHPLDEKYAAVVCEERSKSKSLNSVSSDYGFESKPLDSNDSVQLSGRFPKASPLQLSSLADAPPLSSSGKTSPPSINQGKNKRSLPGKKFEFGQIENRRGTQLAPVRLNTLKRPTTSAPKLSGGMSFMPKGATLSKNLRLQKDETDEEDYDNLPLADSNESLNSDDGSKYSYEETEDEEKPIEGLEPYDMLDVSPIQSADESLDALDINSLVQLGTKLPPRLGNNLKIEQIESINKGNSPSLSLRKVGQPSFLKPLAETTKKKGKPKGFKPIKKVSAKDNYSIENAMEFEDKISAINDEQKSMLDKIQYEWLTMQDELEKQEKERYGELLKDCSKKLEEEEIKLRSENLEKITKIKNELQKKVEDEQNTAEKNLENLKIANKEKLSEEEKKFQTELETMSESFRNEIKMLEEKHANELSQKKKELEEKFSKEIEILTNEHKSSQNNLENCHLTEISKLQEIHKQKIEELHSLHKEQENEAKNKVYEPNSKANDLQEEIEKLEKSLKEETEKYQNLLKEKDEILKDLALERENLENAKKDTANAQTEISDLQDEVEKIENDLDLLRTEKSAFISELNILKENISREKSNLQNQENKVETCDKEIGCSKEISDVGINTDHYLFNTFDKDIQVTVSGTEVSCQVESFTVSVNDAFCQTCSLETSCKSCQTDDVASPINKVTTERINKEQLDSNSIIDKSLENALDGLSLKLESRISGIENHLRLLQENLSKSSHAQPFTYSQEFIENQFTEVKSVPHLENTSIFSHHSSNSNGVPTSSHNKCRCELGDITSCNVLQDVKSSVYRLNDILSHNFVSPLSNNNFYQLSQPMNSFSSPFDGFYAQLREFQEKHRLNELKNKCENEAVKLSKNSININDPKSSGSFSERESLKPSNLLMHSTLNSFNVPQDPVIRAKNIVLREQAKVWKEQQSLNSLPHIFSVNALSSSSAYSQSSVSGFSAIQSKVPSSQPSFFNFEVDRETDYNMWMTRLNALQLRIRSHKMP